MNKNKKPSNQYTNPHYYHLKESASISNLSFSSSSKQQSPQKEKQFQFEKQKSKHRIICMAINAIYHRTTLQSFYRLRSIPLTSNKVRKRMATVIINVYRRNDYLNKLFAFVKLRKQAIANKRDEINHNRLIVKNMQKSAARILCLFVRNKRLQNFQISFSKIQQFGTQLQLKVNRINRKTIRIINNTVHKAMRRHFYHLRDSWFIQRRKEKCRCIVKVLKEYRQRRLSETIERLRINLWRKKQQQIKAEVRKMNEDLNEHQNEELQNLKQRQIDLEDNLRSLLQEKQQLEKQYKQEVQTADIQNQKLNTKMEELQKRKLALQEQIHSADEKLKQPYEFSEICQCFYNNLLLYIHKQRKHQKPLIRTEMLTALKEPLIPLYLDIDQLKEENKIMRELINEYVLIYGDKGDEIEAIQIPYEYLVKENRVMYEMLKTLVGKFEYDRKEFVQLRDLLGGVQKVVKEFGFVEQSKAEKGSASKIGQKGFFRK